MYDRGATPQTSLRRAYELGRQSGLRYVYVGNMPGARLEDTYCPNCNRAVIERRGFQITQRHIQDGRCTHCGTVIDGVRM